MTTSITKNHMKTSSDIIPHMKFKFHNNHPKAKLLFSKSCFLCKNKTQTNCYAIIIQKALYTKFSSSQNYFYTKEINEILLGHRTSKLITYKYILNFYEENEYLKRFYFSNEFNLKLRMLRAYYKYHHDIPRLFMIPISLPLNKNHNKKRRLEYAKITKIIKEEEKKVETIRDEAENSWIISHIKDSFHSVKHQKLFLENDQNILKDLNEEKSILYNLSNLTIKEWQTKLKEITSKSNRSIYLDKSLSNHAQFNRKESLSNLNKFLDFMHKKESAQPIENIKKTLTFPIGHNKLNMKKDFPSLNLNKKLPLILEKPQLRLNLQKLSLSKKLAIFNEKTKGILMSFTERTEYPKKKISELFQQQKILIGNRKIDPIIKNINLKGKVSIERIPKITQIKKEKNCKKSRKLDQELLNFLIMKEKQEIFTPSNVKLTTQTSISSPQSYRDLGLKSKENDMMIKEKKIALIKNCKEYISGSLSLKTDQKIYNFIPKVNGKLHSQYFSNKNFKRCQQPNPLSFQRKRAFVNIHNNAYNKSETFKALHKSSYKKFLSGNNERICLTERNEIVSKKINTIIKRTQNICHKSNKSEPKLLKKEELSGSNQLLKYKNNNVPSSYVNEIGIDKNSLPSSFVAIFKNIKTAKTIFNNHCFDKKN